MAQQVKLLFYNFDTHVGMSIQSRFLFLQPHLLSANASGKATNDDPVLVSQHQRDADQVPNSRLWSGPATADAVTWRMN